MKDVASYKKSKTNMFSSVISSVLHTKYREFARLSMGLSWVFQGVKDAMKDPMKDERFLCVLFERRAY